MPSVIDQPTGTQRRSPRLAAVITVWNRKLHYYFGLYFLFFVWLFAFTGLLLNHSSWRFAEFWPNRKVSTFERRIQPPAGDDLSQARDLMRQLGIAGEIQWSVRRSDPGRLDFQAGRPGHMFEIAADLQQGSVKVKRTEINGWGIVRVLHTFTGVRMSDPTNQRDWILTSVWALSMDAVAAGLIVMVLSGVCMWCGLKGKRNLGVIALGLGMVSCGFLVFGLRWIYP